MPHSWEQFASWRVPSGRLWFIFIGLLVIVGLRLRALENLRSDEMRGVSEVGARTVDLADDYHGLQVMADDFRRRPRFDGRWDRIKNEAWSAIEDALMRADVERSDPLRASDARWLAVYRTIKQARAGLPRAERELREERADSINAEKLTHLVSSWRARKRSIDLWTIGSAVGLLGASLLYRPSRGRKVAAHFQQVGGKGLTLLAKRWKEWDGEWVGLNRAQRAALVVLGLFSAGTLVALNLRRLQVGSLRHDELMWGIAVPTLVLALVAIVGLAVPARRS